MFSASDGKGSSGQDWPLCAQNVCQTYENTYFVLTTIINALHVLYFNTG